MSTGDQDYHTNGVCPNCGYCPHCGRGRQLAPMYPYPWYPVQPWYQPPIWIGPATGGTVGGTFTGGTYTYTVTAGGAGGSVGQ